MNEEALKQQEMVLLPPQELPPLEDFKTKLPDDQNILFRSRLPLLERSTVPTHVPKTFLDQFVIYNNTGTYRLYIYMKSKDATVDGVWRYVTLT